VISLALGLYAALSSSAGAIDRLTWDDLIPIWQEPEDPFLALAPKQQEDVLEIFWTRSKA